MTWSGPVPLMDSATRTAAQRSPGGSRSTNPHSRRSGTPERQPDCGDGRRERPPGRKCVLIVEDHPLNMKLFQALLETQSYRTIEATEGRAGLDLAREHDPDLIILDIRAARHFRHRCHRRAQIGRADPPHPDRRDHRVDAARRARDPSRGRRCFHEQTDSHCRVSGHGQIVRRR
jgi:CheY-like chemotaxis protein